MSLFSEIYCPVILFWFLSLKKIANDDINGYNMFLIHEI